MNADEIVAYFINEVAPVYNGLKDKEKKIYYAILQSLSPDLLNEVISKLSKAHDVPWDLMGFIDWLQKDHTKKEELPNEPISTLLRWFLDKKSGKVSYAYARLIKRFEAQSYADQQRILRACLAGGKKPSEWAAGRLRRKWIPSFEDEIDAAWKAHKGSAMARTIIYMMPEEYVMTEQAELLAALDTPDAYSIICGRLGHTPGFEIDEKRLSILDWFYVVGKLGLMEKVPEMDEKANQYILQLNCDDYVGYDRSSGYSLLYDLGMSRIIWSMKQLHHTDGIVRLAKLEQSALCLIDDSGKREKTLASLIDELKTLVNDDLPY